MVPLDASHTGDSTPVPNARTPPVSFALAPSVVDPGSDDAGCKDDVPTDHALDPPPAEPPPDLPPAEPHPDAPEGSLIYAIIHTPILPRSPTSPFEFPLSPHMSSLESEPPGLSVLNMTTIPDFPSVMDSIMRVIGSPRVFGLSKIAGCAACAPMHSLLPTMCLWMTALT